MKYGMFAAALGCMLISAGLHGAGLDGKALFDKRCGGCHAVDADHEGPRLRGVVGRPVGSVKSFEYSKAMQNARFTWDAARLDHWLADTDSVVPGNEMTFRVPKAEERAAIIVYLQTLRTR